MLFFTHFRPIFARFPDYEIFFSKNRLHSNVAPIDDSHTKYQKNLRSHSREKVMDGRTHARTDGRTAEGQTDVEVEIVI